jgi:hypothetical protein
MLRKTLLAAIATQALVWVPGAVPADKAPCVRFAAVNGSDAAAGTKRYPFATPQRLADSLRPGQVGCLRGGTYNATGQYVLRVSHGGAANAPITIRGYVRERAVLRGVVYVPQGSDHVRLAHLWLVGTGGETGVEVNAVDTVLANDDITNGGLSQSCMILGENSEWGPAVKTVIRGDRIHDCGTTDLHHAIYLGNSQGAVVTDNLIWGISGYGVHLYPNAQNTLVNHNVIDDTGRGGVIFAGESGLVSSGNVVEHNVISDSRGIQIGSYWGGGGVGAGNVARENCVWAGKLGNVPDERGFLAAGNIVVNPRYVNRDRHDFRLLATSRCFRVVGYDTAALLRRG